MMIERVISGGQTGADMGGLIAAHCVGIPTGGWAPQGYVTERGCRVTLLKSYGLREHRSAHYPPRTIQNVKDADCTLIFANHMDGGSRLTANHCLQMGKPFRTVRPKSMHVDIVVTSVVEWLCERGSHIVLNVAGNRESRHPGIEASVAEFMETVLIRVNRRR